MIEVFAQSGHVGFGGDMANNKHLKAIRGRVAYMPQGLANLYPTLSVFDNIDFFGRLSDNRPPSAGSVSPSF